jgi:hypothetical protein
MKTNSLRITGKKISWNQVRYFLVSCFAAITWGGNLAPRADAAPIYNAFVTASMASLASITAAFPAAALLTPILTAFINLIPWAVLLIVGGIVIWQAYLGYQEYDRENFSGIVKPVLNIIVLLMLVVATDRIVTFIFTSA